MWPMLLDIPKDECKRILRRLELEAYASLVSAVRAQGELSKTKRQFLQEAASVCHISTERHRAEIRRAVNDEKLSTIAERLAGPNTGMEWAIEGRRLVPLMPRLTPQTAFTALANKIANVTAAENAKLPPPQTTAQSPEIAESEEPAAPESSRTAQTQVNVAASSSSQTSTVQMSKVDESDTRKRRRSSLEIIGQPLSPTQPKVAAVGIGPQPVPRTLTIPVNVAPVKLSIATTPIRATASTSSPSTTQKVIIMSGSTPVSSASLLQRSLSVPMVKTVATTLNSPSTLVSSSSLGPPRTTTPIGSVSGLQAAQRLRPKPVTTATVIPRGRSGSIVFPNTPSSITTASLQLKPVSSMPHKPTLHIKQDGTGMKIIAGGPKLMPKPATVVATTTGTTRVVTLTATPRVSPSLTSAMVTQHMTQATHIPNTYVTAKPVVTQMGVVSKPITQLSIASTSTGASTSKTNVIVVKKGTNFTAGQGITLTPAHREMISKVVLKNAQVPGQKPTNIGTPQAMTGSRQQDTVYVVEVNNETVKANSVFSGILQASGIIPSASSSFAKNAYVCIEDSNESQDEPRSPSSSTDTGSSLEMNQAGDTSLDDDADKMFAPSTSQLLNVTPTKTPTLLLSSAAQTKSVMSKTLETIGDKIEVNTKQEDITDADMQKIEEEMMNLGEGTQLEVLQTELEQETLVPPDTTTDSNETSDTQEMEVETTESLDNSLDQPCSLSLDQVSEDSSRISNLVVEPVSETIGNIIFETTSESSDNKIADTLSDEVSAIMEVDSDEVKDIESLVDKVTGEIASDELVLIPSAETLDTENLIVETTVDSTVVEPVLSEQPEEISKIEIAEVVSPESTSVAVEEVKLVEPEQEVETVEIVEQEAQEIVELIEAAQPDVKPVEESKETTLEYQVVEEETTAQIPAPDLQEGQLDPQSGLFSVQEGVSEVIEKKVDIYSAAISSANITFDSEPEPETTDPTQDDSEEEISLVYTEPDEVMVKVEQVIEVVPEPTSSKTSVVEEVKMEDENLPEVAETIPETSNTADPSTKIEITETPINPPN